MKIILIDDDEELLELLTENLSDHELEVKTALSGKEGLAMIETEDFDVVILDVMMPGMNGFDVLREINIKHGHLPVIMLTARGDEIERVLGLEMGADDYVVKPFSPRELVARIKAIKRREEKIEKKALKKGDVEKEEAVSIGPIELDLKKRKVTVRGESVTLSSLEFDIIKIFIKNKGMVLSRDQIMDLTRGKEFLAFDRSIDVAISRLRQKIEKDPQNPELIKTVWGIGYVYTSV
ncbi:MAG: response regulator transcription factor [Candidatus Eremiobacteraeota bacterium]|nr:response regulator transcription factor [Candidatus Eremiobacteraeota bacterium]